MIQCNGKVYIIIISFLVISLIRGNDDCNREKIVHVVLFITIEQSFITLTTVDKHFMIVPGNKRKIVIFLYMHMQCFLSPI